MRRLKLGEILIPKKENIEKWGYRIWIVRESYKDSSWIKALYIPISEKARSHSDPTHIVSISVESGELIRTQLNTKRSRQYGQNSNIR